MIHNVCHGGTHALSLQGAGNLKMLLLLSLYLISAKLYDDIGYHRGILAICTYFSWVHFWVIGALLQTFRF